jgi:hypothetical protein
MSEQRIEILYGPNGEIIIETFGFKGPSCKEASEFLEKALGTSGETKQKIEWHLTNDAQVQQEWEVLGVDTTKLCG